MHPQTSYPLNKILNSSNRLQISSAGSSAFFSSPATANVMTPDDYMLSANPASQSEFSFTESYESWRTLTMDYAKSLHLLPVSYSEFVKLRTCSSFLSLTDIPFVNTLLVDFVLCLVAHNITYTAWWYSHLSFWNLSYIPFTRLSMHIRACLTMILWLPMPISLPDGERNLSAKLRFIIL